MQEYDRLLCQIHQEEELRYLCNQEDCSASNKIVCNNCIKVGESHENHQIIPIANIINSIRNIKNQCFDQIISQVKQDTDKLIILLQTKSKSIVSNLENAKLQEQVEQYLKRQFLGTENKQNFLQNLTKLHDLQKCFSSISQLPLNESIEQYLQNTEDGKTLKKFKNQSQQIFDNLKHQINYLDYFDQGLIYLNTENLEMEVLKHEKNPVSHIHKLLGENQVVVSTKQQELKVYCLNTNLLIQTIKTNCMVQFIQQVEMYEIMYGNSDKIYVYNFNTMQEIQICKLSDSYGDISKLEVSDPSYKHILFIGNNQMVVLEKQDQTYTEKYIKKFDKDFIYNYNQNKNPLFLEDNNTQFIDQCFLTNLFRKNTNSSKIEFHEISSQNNIGEIEETSVINDQIIDQNQKHLYILINNQIKVYTYQINKHRQNSNTSSVNYILKFTLYHKHYPFFNIKLFQKREKLQIVPSFVNVDNLIIYEIDKNYLNTTNVERDVDIDTFKVGEFKFKTRVCLNIFKYVPEFNKIIGGNTDNLYFIQ